MSATSGSCRELSCFESESTVCLAGLRVWTARQLGVDTETDEVLQNSLSKRRRLPPGIQCVTSRWCYWPHTDRVRLGKMYVSK